MASAVWATPPRTEGRYEQLFDQSPLPTLVFDPESLALLEANAAAVDLYGYAREELLRLTVADLKMAEDMPKLRQQLGYVHEGIVAPWRTATTHRKKDGSRLQVEVTSHPMHVDGRLLCLSIIVDVSERYQLEQQLRHSQKMEAVGRLAGGIAHDFNNVLNVILNYAEMVADDLGADHRCAEDLQQIAHAAQRAAALTRKLLTFSRPRTSAPRALSLDATVADMTKLLGPVLDDRIRIQVNPRSEGAVIAGDPGEIEQVLMNLVVNARDAMPNGGLLRIETSREVVGGAASRLLAIAPGDYAVLRVEDTGVGMTPEVQARMFEPFFTTKDSERGTGLGLSIVYGIVRRSGGGLRVRSMPGHGTTFDVYLPRVDAKPFATTRPPGVPAASHAGARILLVEDDDAVRAVAVRLLRREGFRVEEVRASVDALRLWGADGRRFDLVISDVGLPDIDGRELVRRMRRTRGDVNVLLMSGHAEVQASEAFLAKPFTPSQFIDAVATALQNRSSASSPAAGA